MATTTADRILTLDVLRGIAVMAIFSVNVVGMAMIEDAYFYPPVYGFHSTGDTVIWALNSVFVDGRFRALFSILFGASLTVVVTRAIAAGKQGWQVHYPRMIVLLAFGCAHFYLLWWGDILANYALVGMIAYLFWRLKPRLQLLAAAIVLALFYVPRFVVMMPQVAEVEQGLSPSATPEQHARAQKKVDSLTPPASAIARDRAEHASIAAHVRASTHGESALEPWESVFGYGLESLGFMLIGMAGFKAGFLTGSWSRRQYAVIAATCLGFDLSLHVYAVYASLRDHFAPLTFMPWTQMYVAPFHAVGAIGYAALIMLVFHRRSAVGDRLAAVGRAAFTNYLGSTIIGSLLFYGTFGGLYGELSRGQAWLIVPPVWLLMLLWSKWWLDRYRYGPFEWAWRSLARWKLQPMRKRIDNGELLEA